MKLASFLAALAGAWLASGALATTPSDPGGEWIRIRSVGIEDKPFPVLWFSANALELPGRQSLNYPIWLLAAEYAEMQTVARTQRCSRTREGVTFELSESTSPGYRAPCLLGIDETCTLLGRIERIAASDRADDRRHAVHALGTRLACPGHAPRR